MPHHPVRDALLGLAAGDALGVPAEFRSRAELSDDPVTDMRGYGTHQQPRGTWSDDSSMAFCLADSLTDGYDLTGIARSFVAWKEEAWWTPHGEVFDIGLTTSASLSEVAALLARGEGARLQLLSRESDPRSNGNGALMRVLPLYFDIGPSGVENGFRKVREVSALTHRHIRSALACLVYLILADELVRGRPPAEAYAAAKERAAAFFRREGISAAESRHFDRLVAADISKLPEPEIRSGGYVIDSLEAAVWCLLTEKSYAATVLRAVNLGEDTDTTAAIAGGLAGLYYGANAIPEKWVSSLARLPDIEDLCRRLEEVYRQKPESGG